MVRPEDNGTNYERLSLKSVVPRITVDPESRQITLYFETTSDIASDEPKLDLTIPLSVPTALALIGGLVDALQQIEPLGPSSL